MKCRECAYFEPWLEKKSGLCLLQDAITEVEPDNDICRTEVCRKYRVTNEKINMYNTIVKNK